VFEGLDLIVGIDRRLLLRHRRHDRAGSGVSRNRRLQTGGGLVGCGINPLAQVVDRLGGLSLNLLDRAWGGFAVGD
jgi:hypothetical protein